MLSLSALPGDHVAFTHAGTPMVGHVCEDGASDPECVTVETRRQGRPLYVEVPACALRVLDPRDGE